MIVACPSCRAKFKIDEARIKPPGVRLKCAKCQTMFAVRKRVVASPVVAVEEELETAPSGEGEAVAGGRTQQGARILVAHESVPFCVSLKTLLEREGYEVLVAHDGVQALMRIQRERPTAVVLDAALPKMYGFEICEFLKRNESLCDTRVILVSSDNGRTRYHRPPDSLYGADDYIEKRDISSVLTAKLSRVLSGAAPVPVPPAFAPIAGHKRPAEVHTPPAGKAFERPPQRSEDVPLSERPSPPTDALEEEREKARRLARIIVSDIMLYNESAIQEGIRTGRLMDLLRDDLAEGHRLFRSRVPERIAEERDYVEEAFTAYVEKKSAQMDLPDPSESFPSGRAPVDVGDEFEAADESF
jgi:predicted Zn finger-like uncharacterized protein